ncbi:DinB/UmuC family translesion DNA polymerase [Streptomyces sp. NPDC001970]
MLDGWEARATALRPITELGALLRSRRQAARSVTVVVRTADQRDLAKTRRLRTSSAHTDELRQVVYAVLDVLGLQRARMRRIALVAEAVDAALAPTQLTLDLGREAAARGAGHRRSERALRAGHGGSGCRLRR